MYRKFLGFVAASLISTLPVHAQVNPQELDQLASQLIRSGGYSYYGQIVVDRVRSGGAAAIQFQGPQSVIYVDAGRMRSWNRNTWAFVLGHEIGHQVSQKSNTPQAESDADVLGARLAKNAGYDVKAYVTHLISMPDSCSPTHGCWHGRAKTLASSLGVQVAFPKGHEGHRPAAGLPGQKTSDATPIPQPQARPCIHRMHAYDTVHAFDLYFGRQIACQHAVACQHAAHAYDVN